jgi:hypothetical protein
MERGLTDGEIELPKSASGDSITRALTLIVKLLTQCGKPTIEGDVLRWAAHAAWRWVA